MSLIIFAPCGWDMWKETKEAEQNWNQRVEDHYASLRIAKRAGIVVHSYGGDITHAAARYHAKLEIANRIKRKRIEEEALGIRPDEAMIRAHRVEVAKAKAVDEFNDWEERLHRANTWLETVAGVITGSRRRDPPNSRVSSPEPPVDIAADTHRSRMSRSDLDPPTGTHQTKPARRERSWHAETVNSVRLTADADFALFDRNLPALPLTAAVRAKVTAGLEKFGKSLPPVPMRPTPEEFLVHNMPEGHPTSLKPRRKLRLFL